MIAEELWAFVRVGAAPSKRQPRRVEGEGLSRQVELWKALLTK